MPACCFAAAGCPRVQFNELAMLLRRERDMQPGRGGRQQADAEPPGEGDEEALEEYKAAVPADPQQLPHALALYLLSGDRLQDQQAFADYVFRRFGGSGGSSSSGSAGSAGKGRASQLQLKERLQQVQGLLAAAGAPGGGPPGGGGGVTIFLWGRDSSVEKGGV
ncbi:hypothetical protein ABPG75_006550 [Micractinium tetrahymenae]